MKIGLSEDEAKNIRAGDIVLVPMYVERTDNYFDRGRGMKIVVRSTESDHRPREEREKGPRLLDIRSTYIHSVAVRPLEVGDWVEWDVSSVNYGSGKVAFIDGTEVAVRRRGRPHTRTDLAKYPLSLQVFARGSLSRVLPPNDLSEAEQKAFAK